ncbi:MAG: hypothetical protein K9K88_13455 [Desulfobacterales bacterium]|nr:hypothetical protein [Desulfobacterales bacterium]
MNAKSDPIDMLGEADPELADRLARAGEKMPADRTAELLEDTLWALSMEPSFGRAMGTGLAELAGAPAGVWKRYRALVRDAGRHGPTFGKIMAEALVPVMKSEAPGLVGQFLETVRILTRKGTYTLSRPLSALTRLLDAGQTDAAAAFLDLLNAAFSADLSYNRCLQLTVVLSKAPFSFSFSRRVWQIRALKTACGIDPTLIEPFLEGMEKGLAMLSEASLNRFIEMGRSRFRENPARGRRFFSLESKLGADACSELQVTAALSQIREGLNRYLRARTGRPLSVRPLSALPRAAFKEPEDTLAVFSDSRTIYLPETIGVYSRRSDNVGLYRLMVRLEAGLHEFGTFDFDLEKACERCGRALPDESSASDLERFCSAFSCPALARDLFFIFEQGRIQRFFAIRYPGLHQTVLLQNREALENKRTDRHPILVHLFSWLVIGMPADANPAGQAADRWAKRFLREFEKDPSVETAALMVDLAYPEAAQSILDRAGDGSYRPFAFPFGRRLRPDLFFFSDQAAENAAMGIKSAVEKSSRFRVYKSDLRRLLRDPGEPLSREALEKVIRTPDPGPGHCRVDLKDIDLDPWLAPPDAPTPLADDSEGPVFWYREWDARLDDYLERHVRVRERQVGVDTADFYADTLNRRRHLVSRIRTAFETLKPEGLKILRQWIEGDAFDHRALIDFAVDRKAGKTPSERLYIKRLKQERDIGVLLLVDLSRSTANQVAGSRASVLDVEKEALVLFCEALSIVGDAFAIAGFSGTGRLGVDYFRIKDFEEPLDDSVRGRIGALTPQRSTRMGAAIRHAATQLEALSSRVRLLLIIGDGFPNDLDYKGGYAIADTRRAISETRAKQIYVRALTVNLPADPKLDDLYGQVHHNVISDVRELPDKLLRVYSSLTRC